MESKITCPKCKGCGEISPPRKRTKSPGSLDPNEKFCPMCKVFKTLDGYYKNKKGKVSGYCKKCQCAKPRSLRNKEKRKTYIYRYDCTCKICGILFRGYTKNQYSCSRHCHMVRLNSYNLNKLPNELASQIERNDFYKSRRK